MHRQRRQSFSVFFRLVVPVLAAVLPVSPAWAAQFGELEVNSLLGAPLRASFSVHPDSSETLGEQCLRVVSPAGSGLPAIPGVRISVASAAAGSVRLDVSAASVREPAMRFAVAADCGTGKSVREYVVLALPGSPRAPEASSHNGSIWSLGPEETPARLANTLFPSQPALQRRLVKAIAELNPTLAIADGTGLLPAGTQIVMPDWKRLAVPAASVVQMSSPDGLPARTLRPEGRSGRSDAGAAPPPAVRDTASQSLPLLRLARTLSESPATDERLREMLRLEYRLLTALNDQLAMMRPATPAGLAATGGAPHVVAQTGDAALLRVDPVPAVDRPPAAEASAHLENASLRAPVSPSRSSENSPPALKTASPLPVEASFPGVASSAVPPTLPPSVPGEPAADAAALPYYLAAIGVALLAGFFVARRRNPVSASTPPISEIHGGETLVLDHPPVAPGPAGTVTPGDPQPRVSAVPATAAEDDEPTGTDVNPVMELAEIMLSFGRLQGAAQTLQEYIEANPREALQPWIKLLDIYREGGMRSEYEALAAKLNATYNVEIQRWEAGAALDETRKPVGDRGQEFSQVFTLEELPHVRDRLLTEWGKPACLDYLHHLLRDNRNGRRNGLTLPVIQEILFLIDILVVREAS